VSLPPKPPWIWRTSLLTPNKRSTRSAHPLQLWCCRTRRPLTQAEVTLVSAKAYYEKAEVELDRATGLLLDHAGILIADASAAKSRKRQIFRT